eukprot:1161805-Pelagomonas_calceolata.AAC.4
MSQWQSLMKQKGRAKRSMSACTAVPSHVQAVLSQTCHKLSVAAQQLAPRTCSRLGQAQGWMAVEEEEEMGQEEGSSSGED